MNLIFETDVTTEEVEKLYIWAMDNETRFPGLTYCEGIKAAIDFFSGDCSLEELIGE